jgi:RsiW-degrading membrane proteinase PrsW (M82 family)
MSTFNRVLFFFILPILGVFLYPPSSLLEGIAVVGLAVVFFIFLGIMLWQGRNLALTFSIFLQGMNVIIRLMMFFNNAFDKDGQANIVYIITCLLGLIISGWLLARLDRQDVRLTMLR